MFMYFSGGEMAGEDFQVSGQSAAAPFTLQLLLGGGQGQRENLLLIRDRRVAVSYTVEALRIFDHYHFRLAQQDATETARKLVLATPPPRSAEEEPWRAEDNTVAQKIRDRELFA
jgi:hypothetical protein